MVVTQAEGAEGTGDAPVEKKASKKQDAAGPGRPRSAGRLTWAELMKITWAVDVLACACGGRKRFLCCVFDPQALTAIKASLERKANGVRGSPPAESPSVAHVWARPAAMRTKSKKSIARRAGSCYGRGRGRDATQNQARPSNTLF